VAGSPLIVAAASRPFPGQTVNGDAWAELWHEGVCRLVVVDGLGHGPLAAEASQCALDTLAAAPALSPDAALRRCHEAIRHTRGAAVAIASIDVVKMRLSVASVGNVESLLRQGGRTQRPMSFRGIVGAAFPTIRAQELPLQPGWLFVMHTDGVGSSVDLTGVSDLEPRELAETLLARWGRGRDDATVVVARANPSVVAARPDA
jgi:serine phosphatase RsbU (regulator of sigma subunit)